MRWILACSPSGPLLKVLPHDDSLCFRILNLKHKETEDTWTPGFLSPQNKPVYCRTLGQTRFMLLEKPASLEKHHSSQSCCSFTCKQVFNRYLPAFIRGQMFFVGRPDVDHGLLFGLQCVYQNWTQVLMSCCNCIFRSCTHIRTSTRNQYISKSVQYQNLYQKRER